MTRLVRLYPRSWRDRYEAELVDLLEQRPMSPGDAIDLVRGALDAHLHPQADRPPTPWTHRLPGLAILATGLLWIAAVATARDAAATGADRYLGLAAMTVLLGLPGDYLKAFGRRIAAAFGIVALGFVLMFSTPWELAVVLFMGVVALALGGTLTMAAIRAGVGSGSRWRLLIGTVVAPVVVGAVVSTGLIDEATARLAILVGLPYGIAWTLIGVRLIVRGSPTIIDPPATLGPGPVAREIPA